MKKLKYKLPIIVFASLVFSYSCKKEFLDTFPTNAVAATDAVASTANAYAALNGIHRIMFVQYDAQPETGEGTLNIMRDLLGEDVVYPNPAGRTDFIGYLVIWIYMLHLRTIAKP